MYPFNIFLVFKTGSFGGGLITLGGSLGPSPPPPLNPPEAVVPGDIALPFAVSACAPLNNPTRPPLARRKSKDLSSSSFSSSVPKNLVPAILGVSFDNGFIYPVSSTTGAADLIPVKQYAGGLGPKHGSCGPSLSSTIGFGYNSSKRSCVIPFSKSSSLLAIFLPKLSRALDCDLVNDPPVVVKVEAISLLLSSSNKSTSGPNRLYPVSEAIPKVVGTLIPIKAFGTNPLLYKSFLILLSINFLIFLLRKLVKPLLILSRIVFLFSLASASAFAFAAASLLAFLTSTP